MATSSFEKRFIIDDQASIEQLRHDLSHPRKVHIQQRDYETENQKGIQLLKQRLSTLENYSKS